MPQPKEDPLVSHKTQNLKAQLKKVKPVDNTEHPHKKGLSI